MNGRVSKVGQNRTRKHHGEVTSERRCRAGNKRFVGGETQLHWVRMLPYPCHGNLPIRPDVDAVNGGGDVGNGCDRKGLHWTHPRREDSEDLAC